MGTGQSRRLAKIVSTHATDNGAEVLLNHSFVEWLSSPLLFPTEAVRALKVLQIPSLCARTIARTNARTHAWTG